MLQNIRDNAQGMIAKTIIFVLILSLSIWGMDAIVGGFGGEPSIATVDGDEITEREFERMIQIERQQRLSQMDNPDPSRIDQDELNASVLDNLIQQKLLGQDVARRGLQLTEADVDQMITTTEAFQVDGRFSQERFMQVVRNQGMTVQEFRELMQRDHLTQLIRAVVQGSAFTSPEEARYVAGLFTQTRSFSALEIPFDRVAERVEVSDEEIEDYYNANQSDFKRPESADVSWIVLDRDDLAERMEVEESEVREFYERRISDYRGEEERNAAHILIADGDDVDERVQAVSEALDEGRDFAALAEAFSDDTGSADMGGELGMARYDSYDEAFSDALFGIESVGDVVGPVETTFGRHFIKLLEVETPEAPSFESLEAELRRDLAREMAGRKFAELSMELADLAYSEYDLEAPSELIGVEIQTRDGVVREGAAEPFDHPQLIRQIFSEDVLEGGFNTELVEVASDRSIVARVREYYPAAQLELSDVRDEISSILRARKLRETLESEAAALVSRLQEEGEAAMDDIAGDMGGSWSRYDDVDRGSEFAPRVLSDAVFALPRPEGDSSRYDYVAIPGGVALVKLDSVSEGDEMATEMAYQNILQSLSQRHGQAAYGYYVDQLRDQAEIERR